jgi:hypothetical protein
VQVLDGVIAPAVNPDLLGVKKIGERKSVFSVARCFANELALRASVPSCNQTEEQTNKSERK